jgi:hypothetical protein
MRRLSRAVIPVIAAACLLSAGGVSSPLTVSAGSNGQQMSLDDVNGTTTYGGFIGYNQNCQIGSAQANWPYQYLDLSGSWFQSWNGTVNGHTCYPGANYAIGQGSPNWQTPSITVPPHTWSGSDWWTCAVDYQVTGGSSAYDCAGGKHTR